MHAHTLPLKPRSGWREPMVWVVVGGPLLVVVASIATAVIAFSGADQVVGSGAEPAPQAAAGHSADSPAVWARNHAATPSR